MLVLVLMLISRIVQAVAVSVMCIQSIQRHLLVPSHGAPRAQRSAAEEGRRITCVRASRDLNVWLYIGFVVTGSNA